MFSLLSTDSTSSGTNLRSSTLINGSRGVPKGIGEVQVQVQVQVQAEQVVLPVYVAALQARQSLFLPMGSDAAPSFGCREDGVMSVHAYKERLDAHSSVVLIVAARLSLSLSWSLCAEIQVIVSKSRKS